jgi:hypothetical protein
MFAEEKQGNQAGISYALVFMTGKRIRGRVRQGYGARRGGDADIRVFLDLLEDQLGQPGPESPPVFQACDIPDMK